MTESAANQTPSLARAIDDAIRARVVDVHTAMPGEIVEYDETSCYAKIKLHFKRKFKGKDAIAIPVISGVPVLIPRTQTSHVKLPIKAGDVGLIVFAERSLDKWVKSNVDHDPVDPRTHALSDAVFIPGIYDQTHTLLGNAPAASLEIRNKSGGIEILDNGKFKIGNNQEELISLLKELMQAVQGATVIIPGGSSAGTYPLDPSTVTTVSLLASRINSILGA